MTSGISRRILINSASACLSGILVAFLFPNFNLEFLAWFSLVPLLYSANNSSSFKESFLYGFLAGVVSYIIILYWIVYTVHKFGGVPYYIAVFALLLLASYLALNQGNPNRFLPSKQFIYGINIVITVRYYKNKNGYIVRNAAELVNCINYPVQYDYI